MHHFDAAILRCVLTKRAEMQDKMTPQSSKSTMDKVSEGVSGTYDKAAR